MGEQRGKEQGKHHDFHLNRHAGLRMHVWLRAGRDLAPRRLVRASSQQRDPGHGEAGDWAYRHDEQRLEAFSWE